MEQEMIKRLKEILNYFKLSPSKLADEIPINRSRLSHILNGRNNPTLEVIQGILNKHNDINPDWLLFGKGTMIRAGMEPDIKDLFQFAELNKKKKKPVADRSKTELPDQENMVSQTANVAEEPLNKSDDNTYKPVNTHIKRITVYFGNNEYQDFISE